MTEEKLQTYISELFGSLKQDQWQEHDTGFFISSPHECEYLKNTKAIILFADPMTTMYPFLYRLLLNKGFRRSGEFVYRPHCPSCNRCIPVRVPVAAFRMSRNMKRVWKRNTDLEVNVMPPLYRDDHYQLYLTYVQNRHKGGSMENTDPEDFPGFLKSSWIKTIFYEFRLAGKLLMVVVVDHIPKELSAVYTFFDPKEHARSLGTFGVLWTIDQARHLEKRWLYLGYWIPDCRKMSYKSRFRPLETFKNGRWDLLDGH